MPDLLSFIGARELPHLTLPVSTPAFHMHPYSGMGGSLFLKIVLLVIAFTLLAAGSVLLFMGIAQLVRRRPGTRKKEQPASESEDHRRAA